MGCCNCGCDEKKSKWRLPFVVWIVIALAGLALFFWQP
ncbi:hypothetical protein JCM19237_1546 [Photobacterium aphoticum]|uniref:Uncharacterized protein n=1 Tax=Photobacterium aphoticum TaxID=754436 RepID=A0A090QSN8_9GAMM|nr:hypothetical protein JCM19237_1546 [Photobacterium aphoticum]